jgi:ATP-dependent DNA ligase
MGKKQDASSFPIAPPVKPMLAKLADGIPAKGDFLFEPKWDGFRAIIFRSSTDVFMQSRGEKPLDRYFPELREALLEGLPEQCVVDGEIIIRTEQGLDFDALQMRLHPAESRVEKLAAEIPASFVGFDVLAVDGRDCMAEPQGARRRLLEKLFDGVTAPAYLTPVTRDRETAEEWFEQFEGAGLDGVIVKPVDQPYQPGKRSMIKVKHARTADCVVAGFRWYKNSKDAVGSMLLGLYDGGGTLQHVGVASSFKQSDRKKLAEELAPLRDDALEGHPWREEDEDDDRRTPGAESRWSAGKDQSWEPLRIERVCEVKYDHLQGNRFRHAARFLHWRPDKQPEECTYEQLEVVPSFRLSDIFSPGSGGS